MKRDVIHPETNFSPVMNGVRVCVCVRMRVYVCVCARACAAVLSHVRLFVTPWNIARQAPLSCETKLFAPFPNTIVR